MKSKNSSPHDRFVELERAELVNRLDRLADVRRTVIQRGKALIASSNYPDKKTIRQISRLLAKKLQTE